MIWRQSLAISRSRLLRWVGVHISPTLSGAGRNRNARHGPSTESAPRDPDDSFVLLTSRN